MTLRIPAISLSSPCNESWSAMNGDAAVRHCSICDQSVYNLSAMTSRQVADLFENGNRPCVRFFLRPDGTVLTRDCTVDRSHWLTGWQAHGRRSAALLAVLALAACASSANPVMHPVHLSPVMMGAPPATPFVSPWQPPLMGKVAVPVGQGK